MKIVIYHDRMNHYRLKGEGCFLADSNITKRALSSALRELMESIPFSKISVGDICERCSMHRKSFYYHFKDKYDLVNWIYHTEFITVIQRKDYQVGWDFMEDLCNYFYENKSFYRKTLNVEGQNSFSEYFRDIVASVLSDDLKEMFKDEPSIDFFVDFYTDAFVGAIKRWLTKGNMSAEEFVRLLKKGLLRTSNQIIYRLSDDDEK
ncbi:MAG: dihydroxyacetone kinase transcriptional activator DhaS [Lachnospiraceae bacterium]|nr:dihydroxyacetone kinase transcriptional activator DhaS [Lachnospiraceae bacterium]